MRFKFGPVEIELDEIGILAMLALALIGVCLLLTLTPA
jgi:hypothetical protein